MIWQVIHRWHKRIGIVAALFVVLLTLSGFILNHTGSLGIDNIYIKNRLLLDLYHIGPDDEPEGFMTGDHWVIKIGDRVYLDRKELTENSTALTGTVSSNGYIVIAMEDHILLVTPTGETIEQLGQGEGVPMDIKAIGLSTDGTVVIKTADNVYLVDLENLHWQKEEKNMTVKWSEPSNIPAGLKEALLEYYRGKGLTLERVMLDIHSGRIAGPLGLYVVDIMALLFFLLSLSGAWMWFKRL